MESDTWLANIDADYQTEAAVEWRKQKKTIKKWRCAGWANALLAEQRLKREIREKSRARESLREPEWAGERRRVPNGAVEPATESLRVLASSSKREPESRIASLGIGTGHHKQAKEHKLKLDWRRARQLNISQKKESGWWAHVRMILQLVKLKKRSVLCWTKFVQQTQAQNVWPWGGI